MADYRVLVSGSREWRYPARIQAALRSVVVDGGIRVRPTLVHGNAKGADRLAAEYAKQAGWHVEPHHADWSADCVAECLRGHRRRNRYGEYCPEAGHRRNQAMVDSGPDVVVAFWRDHSGGTKDCLRCAEKAGLHIVIHHDCACHPVGQPALFP